MKELTWIPISELTDAHYDLALYEGRLVVCNDCNGPRLVRPLSDCYYSADDIKTGPWEMFLVIPGWRPERPNAEPLPHGL